MINKSKTYLLPLLDEFVEIQNLYLLENTYIKFDEVEQHVERYICLLYNKEDSIEFNQMVAYYEMSDYLITYYNYDYEVLFVFKFPIKYFKDFDNFKKGKYSQLSSPAKSNIISFTRNRYKYEPLVTDIVDILYKREKRRLKLENELKVIIPKDIELSSKMNIEEETFQIKEYDDK